MRNILKTIILIILWLSINLVVHAKPDIYDCYYLYDKVTSKNNSHEYCCDKFPPPVAIYSYNDLKHIKERTNEVYIKKMIQVLDTIFDENKDWNSNIVNRSQYFLVKGLLLNDLKNMESVKYLKKYLYISYKVEKLFNEKIINSIPEPMIGHRDTAFFRLAELTQKKITATDIINDSELISDKDINIPTSQYEKDIKKINQH